MPARTRPATRRGPRLLQLAQSGQWLGPNFDDHATSDVVNEAIEKIVQAKDQERPFFLWVAFNAVHSPFRKPPDDLYPGPPLPATGASDRAYFQAMIESLDTEVGRLLAAIDHTTTTVIFLGDNGTPNEVVVPPYDPQHAKLTIYEDGIRVPLSSPAPASLSRIVWSMAWRKASIYFPPSST